MSERGCEKCGYILTGLPAAGTIVTCPECGQENDLAVLPPRPMGRFAPVLWGMIPAAVAVLCIGLETAVGGGSGGVVGVIAATGLLIGAGFAGFLTLDRLGLELGMGRAPRSPSRTFAITAGAVIASLVLNATIYVVVMVTISLIARR